MHKWKCPECGNDSFRLHVTKSNQEQYHCAKCEYVQVGNEKKKDREGFFDFIGDIFGEVFQGLLEHFWWVPVIAVVGLVLWLVFR